MKPALSNDVSKPAKESGQLASAIESFNRGDYFAASELFERLCAEGEPELKDLAAAFNRIAAAFHLRFERGGRQSTINLLSQAMIVLDELRPERAGIDLARLYDELAAFSDEVRAAPREVAAGVIGKTRLFIERRRAPKITFLK